LAELAAELRDDVDGGRDVDLLQDVTSPTATLTSPSCFVCALAGEATPTARTVPANSVAIDFCA